MSALNPPASPAAAVPAPEAGAAPVAPPQPQPVAAVSAPAPADAPVVPKQEPAAAPAPAPVAAPASTPASHRSNAMNSLPIRAYLDQTVVPILLDGEL